MPYEKKKYALGSHRQLPGGAGANSHEVNLKKKKFDDFIEKARNADLKKVFEKNQENEKKKQLAINFKEGRMKELQRATNQYEGLEKSDLCRNCRRTKDERYDFYHDPDEYGSDDDYDPGYVSNRGRPHKSPESIEYDTVYDHAAANKFRNNMVRINKNEKRRL